MLRIRIALAALLLGITNVVVVSAHSAEITASKLGQLDVINLEGEIVPGDDDKFESVARDIGQAFSSTALVVLNSPGGNVIAALAIGESIRAKQFSTGVVNGSMCASACGMIWLAGTKRFAGNRAKIGFHAAYILKGDDARESGQANALVGAYLSRLGFSYEAIAYVTAAAPADMSWLHPEDARKVGIQVEVVPDEPVRTAEQPAASQPAPVSVTPALPHASMTAEDRAVGLVMSYYTDWSVGGTNVEKLRLYYGGSADFYGETEPTDKIMTEKRKFSARWPIRHYEIKPGTVFAQCAETCSVAGVVAWDVSSIERNAHSVGTANFVLKIALDGSLTGGTIISENGAVLAAQNDTLPATQMPPVAQASLTPPNETVPTAAYSAGRDARLQYEAWFSSLPDGDYRSGAAFWAENRSLQPPPSCNQPSLPPEWQDGCDADRIRLAPSDKRRHAESDFKAGWNSL